jgi:hypothetical protein
VVRGGAAPPRESSGVVATVKGEAGGVKPAPDRPDNGVGGLPAATPADAPLTNNLRGCLLFRDGSGFFPNSREAIGLTLTMSPVGLLIGRASRGSRGFGRSTGHVASRNGRTDVAAGDEKNEWVARGCAADFHFESAARCGNARGCHLLTPAVIQLFEAFGESFAARAACAR